MIHYFRTLASKDRSDLADRHLAFFLTFTAGAANAGGFMAVQQYTSHMSGIVSAMADHLVLGQVSLVIGGAGALLAFICGAACSAILVNWGRRLKLQGEYAFPLLLEAALLALFGGLGPSLALHQWLFIPATVLLLCFIMGLQNAIITKLSHARIRTTHITGLVTDFGIEMGKLVYWNLATDPTLEKVRADRDKVALLGTLISLFFVGGVAGAVMFQNGGFAAAYFLAALVLLLAVLPIVDDLCSLLRAK